MSTTVTVRTNRQRTPLSKLAAGKLTRLHRDYGMFGRAFKADSYRRARFRILLENARDRRRARKLDVALTSLRTADVTCFPAANNVIGDTWRPFRVERGVTASMRGEIKHGSFRGSITPNMLDSSPVIFLQNARGETMRTLMPSPRTAREMLVQSLHRWRQQAGYKYHEYEKHWSDRDVDTHVSGVIANFAHSGRWTDVLTHPEVIDMIDASCGKPEEQRPVIRLKGALIQKGVALASAIEVNGAEKVFVPTGYFQALTAVVQQVVPFADQLKLLAA
ncbi:MAG TPA: hypothetical protein VG102_00995 [Candidatus Paceibacterota bacterium]|jgi:hypothetical protein|nr:hypothetical protein [Candidatus Paceibacterota bacterium]